MFHLIIAFENVYIGSTTPPLHHCPCYIYNKTKINIALFCGKRACSSSELLDWEIRIHSLALQGILVGSKQRHFNFLTCKRMGLHARLARPLFKPPKNFLLCRWRTCKKVSGLATSRGPTSTKTAYEISNHSWFLTWFLISASDFLSRNQLFTWETTCTKIYGNFTRKY